MSRGRVKGTKGEKGRGPGRGGEGVGGKADRRAKIARRGRKDEALARWRRGEGGGVRVGREFFHREVFSSFVIEGINISLP